MDINSVDYSIKPRIAEAYKATKALHQDLFHLWRDATTNELADAEYIALEKAFNLIRQTQQMLEKAYGNGKEPLKK